MKPLLAILYFFIPCIKDHICTQLHGSREGQLSNNALVIIYSVLMVLSNMKTYIFHIFQVPPPPPIMCHKDKRSPSFHWILRWGDILTGDQSSGSVAIYIMVVQSYWNVVQITICVFSAMAFVVCGYFGQYARGETGRRSVPWKEWDNLEPQTSEIPYGRWSALCPPSLF